jgi:CRISPR-associated endonuclease Csn1
MGNDPTDSALHAAGYLRPDEREVRQRKLLPSAPDLPNPLVRAALFEVRKLVNSIIREYGLPDRIHVELARDAKKSFAERQEIRFEQASRRQEREAAATEIERWGTRPTRDAIERYRLWLEQERFCIYCGQTISQDQLLSGEVDVDHILPRWRSLDDSLGNKVVCHRRCNRDKGDMTVREWLEASEPERYGHVLKLARKLPGSKNRKFLLKDIALDDFVARQLTDTAYVSRLTTQYLKCLGIPIVMTRGQMTADARYLWGLNNILDPAGRGAKNRTDHRHHAIDAVIIALTDSQRLHNLANDRFENVRAPWRDLWEQAQEAIHRINVSHRVRRGVKGALHEEMFYGATQKRESGRMEARITARPWARAWMEVDQAFVRRKPVVEITDAKRLAKVRDATIREILTAHLRDHGIDPVGIKSWKNEARALLAGDNRPRMPSGVPIKKVRMIEEGATFRPVSQRRLYQKVKPGSNHHVVYRTTGPGNSERWIAAVLPMWDAAERARTGKSLIDRSEDQNGRFVMSLSIGESFLIDDGNGGRSLCIVQKMRQDDGRINYKLHTDARKATDISKDNLCLSPEKLRRLNAQKVTVDPVGRVRRSND